MRKEDAKTQTLVEDSDWSVAPWTGGDFTIGHVDEVNGRGALAEPEFVARGRDELLALFKYCFEIVVDSEFWWFCTWASNCADRRVFATGRSRQIAKALADEACVNKAIEEVYEAFGEQHGGLAWKVFMQEASPEEEREFREEQRKYLCGNTNPEEDQA